jgi:hypothetical protein
MIRKEGRQEAVNGHEHNTMLRKEGSGKRDEHNTMLRKAVIVSY